MNKFNFNNNPQKEDKAEMLNYQKSKLAKQQLVFSLFFISILIALGVYAVTRTVYTYYEGYIKLDQNHMRAVDDVYVLTIDKNVGDMVHAGDTLYSYVLLRNILGQFDINNRPAIIHETQDMRLQAELARQEIPVLQTKLRELEKQLKSEKNDIYYGLTNNTKQNDLKAQIETTREELRKQIRRVAIYEAAIGANRTYIGSNGYGRSYLPYSPNEAHYAGSIVHYCCAPADAVVTDIKVAERTVCFKTEPIIDLQHTDYRSANLGIMVYVPSDKVEKLNNSGVVDVIINDDLTLKAQLALIGLRVEDIPRHLLSNFSHDVDAVMAYMTFMPNQTVPFWVLNNNLPVRIRINNFTIEGKPFTSREFYINEDNTVTEVKDSTVVTERKGIYGLVNRIYERMFNNGDTLKADKKGK